jgi:hypothetical protein
MRVLLLFSQMVNKSSLEGFSKTFRYLGSSYSQSLITYMEVIQSCTVNINILKIHTYHVP